MRLSSRSKGAVAASLLCGALVAFCGPSADALPTNTATLTGFDQLVPVGGSTRLRFKVQKNGATPSDLAGVKVEFRANGAVLGTAVSDAHGYAAISVNAPATPTDLVVTGRLAAGSFVSTIGGSHGGSTWTAQDVTLLLAARDPNQKVLVTDIDQTISALPWAQVVVKPIQQLPPVPGAPAGLRDIAKDATVVYTTGRDPTYTAKTKAWLSFWKFPTGPALLRDEGDTSDNYHQRARVLEALQPVFPKLLYGFGNRTTDAQVFHDHGMSSYIFDTQEPGPYPPYAVVAKDWNQLRAMNKAGQAAGLDWATSFR